MRTNARSHDLSDHHKSNLTDFGLTLPHLQAGKLEKNGVNVYHYPQDPQAPPPAVAQHTVGGPITKKDVEPESGGFSYLAR